ncbi:MAG: MarR family winged helix-turn-helix transcriptional regulator [Sphaerochaeta sp.]
MNFINTEHLGVKFKMLDTILYKRSIYGQKPDVLTFTQNHVLLYLKHSKNNTATLKDIEKSFEVSQATMAGVISRLDKNGYVKTFISEEDHRKKMVTLSDKGIKRSKKSEEFVQRSEKLMGSELTEDERKELHRLLDKVYTTLKNDFEEKVQSEQKY